MEQAIIDIYAPHNAKNLTQEQLQKMELFSREDLQQLAKAYPNKSTEKAYLVLRDKNRPDNKQTFPLSTWKNYFELIKVGQTQFVPVSFKAIFKPKADNLKTAPAQDLTKEQAQKELKQATAQAVKKSSLPSLPTSVEQIAQQEGEEIEKKEKPLDKMNKSELLEKYEEVLGEVPEDNMIKAELIGAIEKEQKKAKKKK